jgi:hypothetical protein
MENIYYSVQHRIFVLRLFWSLLLIPHSLPNLSLLCTRHTKIVKLPHLRCYQRRYFRVAKVGSWQCLKIQKHEQKKCYIHSHSTYVAPTLQILEWRRVWYKYWHMWLHLIILGSQIITSVDMSISCPCFNDQNFYTNVYNNYCYWETLNFKKISSCVCMYGSNISADTYLHLWSDKQ